MREMFAARLRRLVWLRVMAERFDGLRPLIEWSIYSTVMDLRALGAGDVADAIRGRGRE